MTTGNGSEILSQLRVFFVTEVSAAAGLGRGYNGQ